MPKIPIEGSLRVKYYKLIQNIAEKHRWKLQKYWRKCKIGLRDLRPAHGSPLLEVFRYCQAQ